MKKLLAFGLLAFAAAVGGIFWNPQTNGGKNAGARPDPRPGASSTRAPASKPSLPTNAAPADQLASLRATKACYESETCDFPQTDPRSYDFAVGRKLADQLEALGLAFDENPALSAEVEVAAREFMKVEDGFVQEQAMKLMGKLPPSPENVSAMLAGLENTHDPLLVEQAMKEWERYIGTAEEERIQEFLAEFIAHGGQFSSEKASEMILSFLNERSLPLFEEKLASMLPESTPARYLSAALTQYKLQRQGG